MRPRILRLSFLVVPKADSTPNLDQLRMELRSHGLRATGARIAILRALREASGPVSHGDMSGLLEGRGWDRTTLYRNLVELAKAGLATRTDLGDHTWRFEAVQPKTGADAGLHPHFVCGSCGVIECLEGVSLTIERSGAFGRALKDRKLEIQVRGTCDRCF